MSCIYFDNAATTAIDPEVLATMLPFLQTNYGNPSSIHSLGRINKAAIEQARKTLAQLINCSSSEVFFNSGGTESNNTILQGAANNLGIRRIITSPIEHHCILHTCDDLLKSNQIDAVDYVNINTDGTVDMNHLEALLTSATQPTLVTLMHANNEIGTLLDLEHTAALCAKYNALFHTDTVQSLGHFKLDLQKVKIHFLTGSAHKFHGPKGIGFMYINADNMLKPFIHGGAQERNMRAGTENLYGIVGLAKALEIAYRDFDATKNHIEELNNYFKNQLKQAVAGVAFNGNQNGMSLSKVLNVSFPIHPKADLLLFNLDIAGICASGGSACSSGSDIGSHVLQSIKSDPKRTSIRFSFSKYNTKAEVDYTINKLADLFS
jgi:cysteine desulfurase